MRWSARALPLFGLLVVLPACHVDGECGRRSLPAGVRFEVTITQVSESIGCSTSTAAVGDTLIHTTGEPVDIGANDVCLTGSTEPPDNVDSLYGVSDTSDCRAQPAGFLCQGSLAACSGQAATLDVTLALPWLTETGQEGNGTHSIHIYAPATDGCPAVSCLERFRIRAKRLD